MEFPEKERNSTPGTSCTVICQFLQIKYELMLQLDKVLAFLTKDQSSNVSDNLVRHNTNYNHSLALKG